MNDKKEKEFFYLKNNIFYKIKHWLTRFYEILSDQAQSCSRQIITFGIFGTIAFPLFAFLNEFILNPKHYENFELRIIMGLLCFCLVLKNYWPINLKWILPIYWYLTLFISLPFFFTFMTLKNNLSSTWLLNLMTVVFLTLLMIDWLSTLLLFITGSSSALLFYYLTSPSILKYSGGSIPLSDFIGSFVVIFVFGLLFSRNKTLAEKEKLKSMRSLGASIAHELRTPLHSISHGISGIKKYLPTLVKSYRVSQSNHSNLPFISSNHINQLDRTCDSIESEIKSSFTVIDMLLVNLKSNITHHYEFKTYSIKEIILKAVDRYPFGVNQEKLVSLNIDKNFDIWGDELLLIHVIFNLLKNALFSIQAAGKGEIQLSLSESEDYNELHFRDTGKGMSKKTQAKIFQRFYSETYHGTGIGLAFCQLVMKSFHGDILCLSEEGNYTEFILFFPKPTKNTNP